MTLQLSTAVRAAQADAIETAVGVTPILRLYNGTKPATPATALGGNTLIAEGTLPSDWLTNPADGTKAKNGTWTLTGQAGGGTGTACTFFRLYALDGTTCHFQGTVTASGGGGDMTLDNNSIANGQTVTVSTFTLTEGNT